MKITIIGTGYVGLVTGACFAELGNEVICVDNDREKVDRLKKLIMPIYEPGLEEIVKRNFREKRLLFSTSIKEAIKNSEVIFIAVGTPSKKNGEADLTVVEHVAKDIARNMTDYRLIVEKSTVPVHTGEWVEHTIKINVKKKVKFDVASNPEFLREGSAVRDFMHPDRIVIGVESKKAKDILLELYRPLRAHILVTNIKSAELIKHASNSFLATKVSFINAVSQICDKVGADVAKVAEGMGLDKRISKTFLDAGIGYGGFCLPKDLDAFITISKHVGYDFDLLRAVKKVNEEQKMVFIKKIEKALWIIKGKTIAVLGLSFKPNTDDMRYAPSLDIIKILQSEGAKIKAYDPQAMDKARLCIKGVQYCKDAYSAVKDVDCLVLLTEWNEFREIDLVKVKKMMRIPLVVDGRNIWDPKKMKKLGFRYFCVGR